MWANIAEPRSIATCTVNFLNIWTPKKFVVITLKDDEKVFLRVKHPKDGEGMANSVDPDQTAPQGKLR